MNAGHPRDAAQAYKLAVSQYGRVTATLPGAVVIALGASSTNITIQGVSDGTTDGADFSLPTPGVHMVDLLAWWLG